MTIVRLRTGQLWIHSPVQFDEKVGLELERLGLPHHFIAPNCYHDLYWPAWFSRFPQATFYCPAGLKTAHPELRFNCELDDSFLEPWENELPKLLLCGMPTLNEFVFLHQPSCSLIVADLVFNLDVEKQSLLGKWLLKLNQVYDRVGCSRIFRRLIKDRPAFDASIQRVLNWDFDRIVPGHGAVVADHGKRVLREAIGV